MLDSIIKFSVRNKLLVTLFVGILISWGTFSVMNIPIDAVPDITNNQVQIVTVSPSLAANEIEQFVTYPVEMAMANVQDVQEIRSISRYGLSVVTVVFNENTKILDARQLVGQQLQMARQEIPDGYGEPSLMPITTGLGEIYQYTLKVDEKHKNSYSPTELRTIHDWIVKRQLNGIPGIVEISSFGGFLKQYQVSIDPKLMMNYNISIQEVTEALKKNNQNTGGSYIQKAAYAYYIRTDGLIQHIQDIENIVVSVNKDVSIKIRDIAQVEVGHPPRFVAMTKDGEGEVVGGITLMLKGANANKVISDVKERIEMINKSLPEGITIEPYLDRSLLVEKVIHTVSKNLIEGGLIVILILVLLLGNLRSGLIVASVIPISMLFAFAMMQVFGVSASVMSLGAIDFGLIVDGTVIIVESVIHQLEKIKTKIRLSSGQMDNLVSETTIKIKNSSAFGAIIILIVYFPILSLSGIEGKMFKPMALTVIFAIVGALILSFTYVPMIASVFLSRKPKQRKNIADKLMDLLYRTYHPVFKLALRYKRIVLGIALMVFVISLLMFNKLGAEFLPDLDEGDLAMQMTIPPGSSLNESIKTSTKAETILLENFPEIKTVVSKIGTAEVPTDPMAIEDADIMIILKPRSEWTSADTREELVDKMKQALGVIAGASFEFTQPIQLRFNELLTGAKADVVVKIFGENLGVLAQKADEASKLIRRINGAADVKVEQIEGLPQLLVDFDRQKLAMYNLNIEDANTMIRTALAGETAGLIFEGERKFDLVVRLNEEYRNDLTNLKRLYLINPAGQQIPLSEIADIHFHESPMQISRENTQRRISIGINVRNRDVQSLVNEIHQILEDKIKLPPGYYIEYGGKFENLQSATKRLTIVVPLALILIFVLLYFAFKSVKQALIIFTTIPLSIIGGVFALWVRDLPFSISAGIGFIALFGVAVLDGIVLINHLNELKQQGIANINKRLIIGTKDRLRPVVVTSAVASFGFLPMALATSAGAEVQRPLATVVIGGVLTSTFLTMILLPLVYYYFEKLFHKKLRLKPVSILLLILAFPISAFSQEKQPVSTINLEEAKTILINNHPEVQNMEIHLEQVLNQKRASFNLGTTDLEYQRGNLNSTFQDYNFSITQNIGSPFSQFAENRLYKSTGKSVEMEKQRLLNNLLKELELLFYKYQYVTFKLDILQKQFQLFDSMERIAELRFRKGDINYLSKLNLESQKEAIALKLREMEFSQKQIIIEFNLALGIESTYLPIKLDNLRKESASLVDSFNVSLNADVEYLNSLVNISTQKIKYEKSKLSPTLQFGFFNQQIDGVQGFKGWQAGISIPLWFFPYQKSITNAKLDVQLAENELQIVKINQKAKHQLLKAQVVLDLESISAFEKTNLRLAETIIENAETMFANGSIAYTDFLYSVNEAYSIKISYLEAVHNYNIHIIELFYLQNVTKKI